MISVNIDHMTFGCFYQNRASKSAKDPPSRIDIRSPHVRYMNDLRKDSMYREWPTSLLALLQPRHPTQLHKGIHSLHLRQLNIDSRKENRKD